MKQNKQVWKKSRNITPPPDITMPMLANGEDIYALLMNEMRTYGMRPSRQDAKRLFYRILYNDVLPAKETFIICQFALRLSREREMIWIREKEPPLPLEIQIQQ